MKMPALGIALAAGLALPQGALACYQLSANVWMCPQDSVWRDAQWDVYGDGATLLLESYALSFTEDFPGADIRDTSTTLEEQFVTYAELTLADGNAPLEVARQDEIAFDTGTAYRSLQRDRYDEIETLSAVMLADIKAARIMLYLDGPTSLNWDALDRDAQLVLNLLRDTCADTATCDSPTQAKVISE